MLLIFALVLPLAGCGAKEKTEEKVAEKITEKIIEGAGGGKVDIDGEKITVKGEDGVEVTVGSTEWPKSSVIKNIPEFKAGTITSVMDSENSAMIIVDKVKEKDFKAYLGELKKDFTEDVMEINSDEIISFFGASKTGQSVQLSYESANETVTIIISQVEK